MNNYLTEIGEAMLGVNIVGLLLILILKQRKTAFEVVLFCTVCLGLIHLQWQFYLESLFDRKDLRGFVSAAWYLGFSSTYFIHAISCAYYCDRRNLIRDKASNLILVAFVCAGFLQLSRYLDRYVFETDVLGALYQSGIPAINALSVIVVFFYVVATYGIRYQALLWDSKSANILFRGLDKWIR